MEVGEEAVGEKVRVVGEVAVLDEDAQRLLDVTYHMAYSVTVEKKISSVKCLSASTNSLVTNLKAPVRS